MPRYRQKFDPATNDYDLVLIGGEVANTAASPTIRGDIEPFKSPIDGTVITGAKAYRDHCKKHNVVPTAEFGDDWYRKKAEERAKVFHGKHSKADILHRKQEINEIINHLERQ